MQMILVEYCSIFSIYPDTNHNQTTANYTETTNNQTTNNEGATTDVRIV